jgi:phosphoenolpyruvate carboxykinase (ATP)
LQEDFINP